MYKNNFISTRKITSVGYNVYELTSFYVVLEHFALIHTCL